MPTVSDHVLKITRGSNEIDFTSGSHKVLEYSPQSPDLSTIDSNSILSDGGERPLTTFRNVTESARILMSNASPATIQTGKHEIQRMFGFAMHRQRLGAGSPVYLKFQPASTASEWRSEVLSGKVELVPDMLNQRWDHGKVEAIVSWTRRYYWEGDLQDVQITNPRGTSTGSLRVDNAYDNNQNNWISIASTQIAGEVPAPALIKLNNSFGADMYPTDIRIFHNTYQESGSLVPTTGGYGSNIAYTGSAYSSTCTSASTNQGEKYTSWSVSSTNNIFKDVLGIKYTGSDLTAFGGRSFSVFMRFHSLISTTPSAFAQFKMMYYASDSAMYSMYEGPEIRLSASTKLHPMGAVKIPPVLNGITHDDVYGVLWIKTSTILDIDYNYLMAMPADNIRVLKSIDHVWPDDSLLVSDDIQEVYYMEADDNVSRRGTIAVSGKKIMLIPNLKQELFFLVTEGSIMSIARQWGVRVQYRPRVLTI